MDVKDLSKSQLLMLAILLSFVISIATGITTVTLMEKAPRRITLPVTTIVRETVEKIVPAEPKVLNTPALSAEEKKILEDLKAIKPLTVTLYLRAATEDKVLGIGLFLGDNRVVIASLVPLPAEGETYIVKSILGEQQVATVRQENDFSVIELIIPEITTEADGNLSGNAIDSAPKER